MANDNNSRPDSPATRLLEFVNYAVGQNGRQDLQQRQIWSTIFRCDPDDMLAICSGIAELHDLITRCKLDSNRIDEPHSALYLETLAEIEEGLRRVNMHGTWREVTSKWNDATIRSLKFVEAGLRTANPRKVIDKDEIKSFLDNIHDIMTKVNSMGLDPRLLQLIQDHLQAIERATVTYHVGGIDYLEKMISMGYGSIFIHLNLFQSDKSASGLFWRLLERGRVIVQTAKMTVGLLPEVRDAHIALEQLLDSK